MSCFSRVLFWKKSTLIIALAIIFTDIIISHYILDTNLVLTQLQLCSCLGKYINMLILIHEFIYLSSYFWKEEIICVKRS